MGLEKGLVLPGVTRSSMLELAREWNEFKVSERTITMAHVQKASEENRVIYYDSSSVCLSTHCYHCRLYKFNGIHMSI